MKNYEGKNVLVTCDNWFYAPDGKQYRAAWGTVSVFSDQETLGIKTNNKSTNWYLQIGKGERQIVIAGCQVKYAVLCNIIPHTGSTSLIKTIDSTLEQKRIEVENMIYIANE